MAWLSCRVEEGPAQCTDNIPYQVQYTEPQEDHVFLAPVFPVTFNHWRECVFFFTSTQFHLRNVLAKNVRFLLKHPVYNLHAFANLLVIPKNITSVFQCFTVHFSIQ